jgi:hypothetical protein
VSNPIASPPVRQPLGEPIIWSSADRVVACHPDGSVVGTFSSTSEAQRALDGSARRWFTPLLRRPRYARGAA